MGPPSGLGVGLGAPEMGRFLMGSRAGVNIRMATPFAMIDAVMD